MYNAIYAIYCVYIALMNIINSEDEDRDEKWKRFKDRHTIFLIQKLNELNYESSHRLPYHNHAVLKQVAYEHQPGNRKIQLLKQQALQPSFLHNNYDLSEGMIKIYEKTWALNEILGLIRNNRFFHVPMNTSFLEPDPNPR